MALLTGRNHHVSNAGAIMEVATAFPGNTGIRPQSVAPLAEMLRLNGYSTAAFGKYHETPAVGSLRLRSVRSLAHGLRLRQVLRLHRRRNQPMGAGHIRRHRPRRNAATPNYHFTVDMTDKAIAWMQAQHSLTPDKPFFMYFATGAPHAPHHVPKE